MLIYVLFVSNHLTHNEKLIGIIGNYLCYLVGFVEDLVVESAPGRKSIIKDAAIFVSLSNT